MPVGPRPRRARPTCCRPWPSPRARCWRGAGRRGCLEAYAGRVGIEARARKRHSGGQHTVLFQIMEREKSGRVTSGVIAQALKKGDALTTALVEEAVQALGAGIASAQNLLDVEAGIVGGGLPDKLRTPFVERGEAAMRGRRFAV